ncbi:hypothetical protein EAF04_007660 [Stromatinia cepivora]|nr:hypothetical protein EAF04_007660 [Stromatinia cepivora]
MSERPGGLKKPFKYIKNLPLYWENISDHSMAEKLHNILFALKSGADPNEVDHAPRAERSMGRPLHYATDTTHFYFMRRHENLPIVELLLKYGADPRIPGMGGLGASPMDDLRWVLETDSRNFDERDMQFLKAALLAMEEKARELDEREAKKAASWMHSCHIS